MIYDYLKHTSFAYPLVLGLLALVPLLLFWYRKNGSKQAQAVTVSSANKFTATSWKARLRHLPFLLRMLSLACIIVALARPQKRNEKQTSEGEGIDIVLCMDVSGSMGSPDIPPSRMAVAKEVAEEFIRSRPTDRIGLVIFSGESFTQCPITSDRATLISQVQTLESRTRLDDGTVIGEGLATAVDRLSKSEAKSKVIILLTDGKEDPPATRLIDPLTALEIAKSRGVKVYTVGMSADPAAATQAINGKKNASADFLDEQLLSKISSETGGQYFRARDKEGLQSIYKQIDQLEKTKVEVKSSLRYQERFFPFMLAALLFIFIETILRFTIFRRFP
jgi:Ca-activated chloride channel homolog